MRAYLLFPLLLLACTQGDGGSALQPDRFEERLATPTAQLIDVRTPAEFAQGHLPGAVNLDWTGGVLSAKLGELDKTTPVLLYCASGRRSAEAAAHLRSKGFTDVADLAGGIHAWSDAGKTVVQ